MNIGEKQQAISTISLSEACKFGATKKIQHSQKWSIAMTHYTLTFIGWHLSTLIHLKQCLVNTVYVK